MKKRILTGGIIFLITAIAILSKLLPHNIGTYIFDIFVVLIAFVASYEMCNIMQGMNKSVNVLLATAYCVFNYVTVLIVGNKLDFNFLVLIELAVLCVYFVVVLFAEKIFNKNKQTNNLTTALNTISVCVYPGFMFSLMVIINHIDFWAGVENFSFVFVVLIFAIAMLTDTLALFVGCSIKGPKLAPKISPNKTISGAIGGLFGGVLASLLVFVVAKNIDALSLTVSMFNLQWWHFVLFGLVGSAIGQAGDLFESKLKRMAKVKDSGSIFPGHGGMLDRIDALTFVTVFVFMAITIVLI